KENLLLKLKEIFTIKRILISLVSLFFILFFVGGCSFKYMDWQWYEYKQLCLTAGEIIKESHKYDIVNRYDWTTITNKPIYVDSRITEHSYQNQFHDGKIFYKYKFYIYKNFGIFLHGDEAAGLHIEISKNLSCKP
ncbi:hypothetical protein CQA53_11740, partial [Helicobacter didelphidarum]